MRQSRNSRRLEAGEKTVWGKALVYFFWKREHFLAWLLCISVSELISQQGEERTESDGPVSEIVEHPKKGQKDCKYRLSLSYTLNNNCKIKCITKICKTHLKGQKMKLKVHSKHHTVVISKSMTIWNTHKRRNFQKNSPLGWCSVSCCSDRDLTWKPLST